MGDTKSFRLLRAKRLGRGCEQRWSAEKACPLAKEQTPQSSVGPKLLTEQDLFAVLAAVFSIGLYHGHGILRGILRTQGSCRVLLDSMDSNHPVMPC